MSDFYKLGRSFLSEIWFRQKRSLFRTEKTMIVIIIIITHLIVAKALGFLKYDSIFFIIARCMWRGNLPLYHQSEKCLVFEQIVMLQFVRDLYCWFRETRFHMFTQLFFKLFSLRFMYFFTTIINVFMRGMRCKYYFHRKNTVSKFVIFLDSHVRQLYYCSIDNLITFSSSQFWRSEIRQCNFY